MKLPLLLLATLGWGLDLHAEELKHDESVVLFPTFAHRSGDGKGWELTAHGWVFEPERRATTLAGLRKALDLQDLDLTPEAEALFVQRATPFLYDNERGKRVSLHLGNRRFISGRSDANGHFTARIRISNDDVAALRHGGGNVQRSMVLSAEPRQSSNVVTTEVFLLDNSGLSVISDIDDTIKISEVANRKALLGNTFLKSFLPVEGMSPLFQSWAAKKGAQFHYVSASPWQLYAPLSDFMKANRFPPGTFHMKPFRWKDRNLLQLFASPTEHKLRIIEPILKQFPDRRFVLVGDSGEQDPEIYAALARKYSQQVVRILIRDVTIGPADIARFDRAFKDLSPVLWKVFRDPRQIADENWL